MSASPSVERFRWRSRILLVFARGEPGRPEVPAGLLAALERRPEEIHDRDLIVVAIALAGGPTRWLFPPDGDADRPMPLDGERLLADYRPPTAHATLVLLGKDGGEKRRRTLNGVESDTVEIDDLFALIDSMPMRRREMRDRGR